MRDVREMIANISETIEWKQEELDKELELIAEKAQQNRNTYYYVTEVEQALEEAKRTQAQIRELKVQKQVLELVLEED